MDFRPANIVICPLHDQSISLAANIVLDILREKNSFEMLHLSVIAPLAHSPDSATAPSPTFDIVQSTIEELVETQSATVLHDITSLDDVSWIVDLSLDGVAVRRDYYARNSNLASAKVMYVRPVELPTNADALLLDNEVLLTYSVLVEDLPYLPPTLDSALSPAAAAAGGRERRPSSIVLHPLPLHSLTLSIIQILSSRFIYQNRYNITGSPFTFPPLSVEEHMQRGHVLPGGGLVDVGGGGGGGGGDGVADSFDRNRTLSAGGITSYDDEASDVVGLDIPKIPRAPIGLSHSLSISSEDTLYQSLDVPELSITVADLRSPSGRPLKSLLAGLKSGAFERYSPDWKALMHMQLPEVVLIDVPSDDDDEAQREDHHFKKHHDIEHHAHDGLPICGGQWHVAVYTPGMSCDAA
ncbi:hypothetical protein RI367_000627 [Sorochytrium milnesiophthora]